MAIVRTLTLNGFKSIRSTSIEFEQLNVLIGLNGSGKTNLLSFFTLLNFSMTRSLQLYVNERCGGASSLLFGGPKVTPQFRSTIAFRGNAGINTYDLALTHGAGDSLIYTNEEVCFMRDGAAGQPDRYSLGGGHTESSLAVDATLPPPVHLVRKFLKDCRSYQFHDTSIHSPIRQNSRSDDVRPLLSDGGNLPAVLMRLRDNHQTCFSHIESKLREALPWFLTFDFEIFGHNSAFVRLGWKEKGSISTFRAHQASDGTLRLMSLLTLLNQPPEELPSLIVIDEPELGLHPLAIELLADEMRIAAKTSQLLVSTQSMELLDALGTDPIVAERNDKGESVFSRRAPFDLEEWLDEYSVGARWESRRR